MGCHFLLQGIFPTQGLNQGLPHCKQTLLLSEPPGKILAHIENRLILCFSARVFQGVAWFYFSRYYCYACWRKEGKRRSLFHGSRKETIFVFLLQQDPDPSRPLSGMKTQKQKAVGPIALPHAIMEEPYQNEHTQRKFYLLSLPQCSVKVMMMFYIKPCQKFSFLKRVKDILALS